MIRSNFGRRLGSLSVLAGSLLAGLAGQAVGASLQVAILSRTAFYVPLWVADREGYLKHERLEAPIRVYDNADSLSDDRRTGKVQVSAGLRNLGPVARHIADYQFTSVNVDTTLASANRDELRDRARNGIGCWL